MPSERTFERAAPRRCPALLDALEDVPCVAFSHLAGQLCEGLWLLSLTGTTPSSSNR